MMTVTNRYSQSANPSRGYHDSEFRVVFEQDSKDGGMLTEEGQKEYMDLFFKHLNSKGYMWCHAPKRLSEVKGESGWQTRAEWVIQHGFDSGD